MFKRNIQEPITTMLRVMKEDHTRFKIKIDTEDGSFFQHTVFTIEDLKIRASYNYIISISSPCPGFYFSNNKLSYVEKRALYKSAKRLYKIKEKRKLQLEREVVEDKKLAFRKDMIYNYKEREEIQMED